MRMLAVLLASLAALLVAVPATCARTAQRPVRATIAWATHGVPHIQARTWEGLGYGYGYALASQDVCILADSYTTVRGERSRFFGPDARYDFRGNGTTANNLDYEQRGDERIPIHGGPGTLGVFNAINVPWDPGRGYPDVPHGSSFIMTVRFTGGSCPQSESILSYSQSASPESPYFADQTRAYSAKRWTPMRFCASQLRRDPNLRVEVLRQGRRPARAVRTQDLSETLTARAAASRPPSTSR